MTTAQTLQTENSFIQRTERVKKESLRKGDYLLLNLVIWLWLKPSEWKTGVVTISSLLPFCSTKEDIFCSSLSRFTSELLLQPFEVYQKRSESSKANSFL